MADGDVGPRLGRTLGERSGGLLALTVDRGALAPALAAPGDAGDLAGFPVPLVVEVPGDSRVDPRERMFLQRTLRSANTGR